ncbi:hypothetical protein O181_037522 [Austropuccinia psidii MF-1]|uniref:Uncharacterized protein n=1 Tax=Austropuccinia psidii MF-1 TaxID=1389203 RepID=A0A9Q3DCV5_9BASI|nr:hypothetical protein [Austropuccinia psidii MF-1]
MTSVARGSSPKGRIRRPRGHLWRIQSHHPFGLNRPKDSTGSPSFGIGVDRLIGSGQLSRVAMSFNDSIGRSSGNSSPQARLACHIPLIRAPGTWLPKPVVLPSDLHPIPDDITAYFVYPYSLEASSLSYLQGLSAHKLNMEAALQSTQTFLDERQRRKEAARLQMEQEREERKKESLRLVAPGWSGEMDSILTAPSPPTASSSQIKSGSSHPEASAG